LLKKPVLILALKVILIVFWPALIWLGAYTVVSIANLFGCKIWARGPEQCILLGVDIGPALYPLWAMGYYLGAVVAWIPIGLCIVALWGFVSVVRK